MNIRTISVAIGAVIVIVGAVVFWQNGQNDTAAQVSTEDINTVQDMTLGNPDAPVTMIEYASFTCPHCKSFHEGPFKQLKADYIDTGKINFIYREIYFDRFGLWASIVARCGGVDKFFAVSDLIYSAQRQWTQGDASNVAANLRRIGLTAGLGKDQLDACLDDNENAERLVAWEEVRRTADGIESTPSFVINGTRYSNMSYSQMKDVIDDLLGS